MRRGRVPLARKATVRETELADPLARFQHGRTRGEPHHHGQDSALAGGRDQTDRFELDAAFRLACGLGSPVYLRLGKADRGDVHDGPLELSVGELLKVRDGNPGGAILATGSMVKTALDVVADGLDAEVWSVPTIKPIDAGVLEELCRRVDWLVVLEEHSVLGGLGACVAEAVTSTRPIPVCRIGVEDRFSEYCGSYEYLLKEHRLDSESVKQRIAAFLNIADGGHNPDSPRPR